jgi:hypothetical protein
MTFVKRITGAAALGTGLLIGCDLIAPPAQAAYVVTLNQVGSNVVATGSGSLDLSGLNFVGGNTAPAQIESHFGLIFTGSSSPEPDLYTGITGPASFGSGSPPTRASSGSGDLVGINAVGHDVFVPAGYVSGSALLDSSTYDNQTFNSLGVTPGTYTWTWEPPGAAADDSFTLVIPAAAVPEPSSVLLLALPLGLVVLLAASRRRAARRGYQST